MSSMKLLLTSMLALTCTVGFSQCIAEEKMRYGGDFGVFNYTYFCPTYGFSYTGETSKTWSILNPIDIRQAENNVLSTKAAIEREIISYAGSNFFSQMKFSSVSVVYLDSIAKFKGRGPSVDMKMCKGRYFYYYYFQAEPKMAYCIGVAVDEQGKILSPFNFPSKHDYQPIDTTLTVCKVLELARKFNKKLGPIKEVTFEYNPSSKRFYWLVSEKIARIHSGLNTYNQVVIDAAEPKRIKAQTAQSMVSF